MCAKDFPSYARVFWAKEDLLREGIPATKELALCYMAEKARYRLHDSKLPNFKAFISDDHLSGSHYVCKVEFAENSRGYGFFCCYVRPEMGAGTAGPGTVLGWCFVGRPQLTLSKPGSPLCLLTKITAYLQNGSEFVVSAS